MSGNREILFSPVFYSIFLSDPIVDHQLEQTRADEFKLTLADNHLILRLKTQIQDEKNQYKKNFQHTLLMGNIRSVFSRLGLDVRIVPTSDDYLILLNAPASSSDLEHLSHHIPKLITSLAQEYPDLHISAAAAAYRVSAESSRAILKPAPHCALRC